MKEYFRLEEILPLMLLTMITTFMEEQLDLKRVGQVDTDGGEICKRSNTLLDKCK